MEFTRKKKRGQHSKVHRTWVTSDSYRIVWRREACGVAVPPRFQATVRVILPNNWEMWDFCDLNRRLIKTMKAAQEVCDKHKRLWIKACEASGTRELRELFGGKIPNGMPIWATKKANRKVYGLCMDGRPAKYREDDEECNDPSDQPETSVTSPTSSTGSDGPANGPASAAVVERPSVTPPQSSPESPVQPAKAPAKARKPRSPKSTVKRSGPTSKGKQSTKGSSSSAKKPSGGSRKTRSKPSKN